MATIPLNQEIRFAYGEFATRAAAATVLGREIESAIGVGLLTKTERESVAWLMMKLHFGSLSVGPYEITWQKDEGYNADVLYTIKS